MTRIISQSRMDTISGTNVWLYALKEACRKPESRELMYKQDSRQAPDNYVALLSHTHLFLHRSHSLLYL